ncbi:oxidoreductase [Vulcanimicrobium alpinum]|uniref:Oxidoreductase n=1 Tax=Vulcanimicrobium alpinum TaxID=3016050 RepID=A0AAN1XTR8_UNVUL|nr:NADP-dependent oxidoreductase [Vulcanimicrobium alpinum]BDE04989.1 oxidoreductase [Vulcanimicrobium alpinum]
MQAVVAHSYGDLDALRFESIPDPTPAENEIVLRVEATSLNPVDLKVLSGALKVLFETHFPYVPGVDAAGTVVAVGPGVTGYAVGDRVGGAVHAGLAEFARADITSPLVARVPDSLETVTAAAAPVVGLAALDARHASGDVLGKNVVVIGATGSVGRLVVQLAASGGARVTATARPRDVSVLRSLGASDVIDYDAEPIVEGIRKRLPSGADVVVDLVHVGAELASIAAAVVPGGRLVSTLFGPTGEQVGDGVSLTYVRMDEGGPATTAEVYAALVAGSLRLDIGRTFPFAEAIEALRALQRGDIRGKLVVTQG